jgi:uncharacterized coiled-coil DUF342 family protein
VVAEKIRELAEISLTNAQTIGGVLKNIHRHIDKVTSHANQTKETMNSLGVSSHDLRNRFGEIRESINMISTVLKAFETEFQQSSSVLKETKEELDHVKESSKALFVNAEETKNVITILTQKSGELKSLADGFDVVLNNRKAERTVVTPPIKAKLANNAQMEVYLFDDSVKGISFYCVTSESTKKMGIGDRGRLQLETPLKNMTTINFEIVFVSQEDTKDLYFYGAKKL